MDNNKIYRFAHKPAQNETRSGITLLEIVLALSIFIGAFAAISQILNNGSRTAIKGQLISEAVFRGENQLNSMLSGVTPLQSSSRVQFDDDAQWVWTANVIEAGVPNLMQVELIVEHLRQSDNQPNATFTLTRLIRDPQMYYDAALESSEGL